MIRLARSACTLLFLLIAVFVVLPAQGNAAEVKQWMLTPTSTIDTIQATKAYNLNNDTGGHLGYGHRTFGADLVWGGTDRFTFFRKNTRDHRTIKPTEAVALYNAASHRYLHRSHQDFGIALDWSTTPSYEWKVVTGQTAEGNVRSALYNTIEGGYLIYQSRTWGINLGFQGAIAPGAAF